MKKLQTYCPTHWQQSSEFEPDENFIEGLLLRVKVEDELNDSQNWIDCPRCGSQMWRSSALCDRCEHD